MVNLILFKDLSKRTSEFLCLPLPCSGALMMFDRGSQVAKIGSVSIVIKFYQELLMPYSIFNGNKLFDSAFKVRQTIFDPFVGGIKKWSRKSGMHPKPIISEYSLINAQCIYVSSSHLLFL